MPSPDLYSEAGYDPFPQEAPLTSLPDFEVVYATLRDPAIEDDGERFYANRRGNLLRVGTARVQAGDEDFTWEQARRVSLLKNRPGSYPLKVTSVEELGVVASSIFAPPEVRATEPDARAAFARLVDERLERSRAKDVYVYVHGYKVVFENPVLVASELWHFLGYEGVMVAFSWPATPSKLAYFSDLETAAMSARGLRRLLSVLAQDTQVERIHVLGYSAGTRLVAEALNQVALLHRGDEPQQVFARRKLGQVLLVGSDIDRQTMGAYIEDGLLGAVEHLTVYVSRSDKALGLSRWVMGGRERLGQSFGEGAMSEEAESFLRSTTGLTVVDVTDAEDFDAGNGHSYFRRSPWVASDVLLTLGHGLGPDERGLARGDDTPIWSFPPDYVERLQGLLPQLIPGYLDTN
jgi:esterase/lipase superfamily enzyme